jgi:hypothetical protein
MPLYAIFPSTPSLCSFPCVSIVFLRLTFVRLVHPIRSFHVHGLMCGLLAPVFAGGSLVIPSRFDKARFWNDFATEKCNWYTAGSFLYSFSPLYDSFVEASSAPVLFLSSYFGYPCSFYFLLLFPPIASSLHLLIQSRPCTPSSSPRLTPTPSPRFASSDLAPPPLLQPPSTPLNRPSRHPSSRLTPCQRLLIK